MRDQDNRRRPSAIRHRLTHAAGTEATGAGPDPRARPRPGEQTENPRRYRENAAQGVTRQSHARRIHDTLPNGAGDLRAARHRAGPVRLATSTAAEPSVSMS